MKVLSIFIILLLSFAITNQQSVGNEKRSYTDYYLYHSLSGTIGSSGVFPVMWTTISSGILNYLKCASPNNVYYCWMQMTESGATSEWKVVLDCGPEVSIPIRGVDPILQVMLNNTDAIWNYTMASGTDDINANVLPLQYFPAYTTLGMQILGTPGTNITFPGEIVGREMEYDHLWWEEY